MYVPCGKPWKRDGRTASRSGGPYPYTMLPCRDGFVALIGRSKTDWQRILTAMGNPDWSQDPRFEDPFEIADHSAADADALLTEWLNQYTRAELAERGRREGIALAPVLSVEESLDEPHFRSRGTFSRSLQVGEARFTPARPPWKEMTPASWFKAQAPRLGEHTDSARVRVRSPRAASAEPPLRGRQGAPLSGLRVVDFSWVWSGPMVGATLADLGADVIKVEHRGRLDNARLRCRPSRDGRPLAGPLEEVSFYFAQNNRGKRSITVDIKHPDGLELVRRLISRCDVMIENLSQGVFDRVGLNLDELVTAHPRLVVLSMPSMGDGPWSDMRAYAPVMTALSGVESLVGYEDAPCIGMMTLALGDPNAASHALVALLAALNERERTARGRRVEVPQVEAMMTPLAEAVAELQVAHRDPTMRGMAYPLYAPYGHYRCKGGDRWIALAIDSDDSWHATTEILDSDALRAKEYATTSGRRANRHRLDELLTDMTCREDRDRLVRRLRASGVAAAPVHELEEMLADPHLRERDLFHETTHPFLGRCEVASVPWRLTGYVPRISPAPLVGQHTREVLREILGLDEDEVNRLKESGALS